MSGLDLDAIEADWEWRTTTRSKATVDALVAEVRRLTDGYQTICDYAEVLDEWRSLTAIPPTPAEWNATVAEVRLLESDLAVAVHEAMQARARATTVRDLVDQAEDRADDVIGDYEGFRPEAVISAADIRAALGGGLMSDDGAEISRLRMQLEQARDEAAIARQDRDDAEAEMRTLQADLARLLTENAAVRAELDHAKRDGYGFADDTVKRALGDETEYLDGGVALPFERGDYTQ